MEIPENDFEKEWTELVNSSDPRILSYSDTQYHLVMKYITAFQDSLDETHDVGLLLTNFGQSVLMEVTDISFERPVLMVFKGIVSGQCATLIQHVNQLNFLLTTVPKPIDQPHRKLGFNSDWK